MTIEVLFGYNFLTKDINNNKKFFKKKIIKIHAPLFIFVVQYKTIWAY